VNLRPRLTLGAKTTAVEHGWDFEIPAGAAGSYRLAQLDDYATLPRNRFTLNAPTTLSLRCRVSAANLPGTWGFGFWNDPFSISLGLQGTAQRLPTLPNAGWFFHASTENHLSFTPQAAGQTTPPPGNSFLAQTFSAPRLPAAVRAPGMFATPLLLARPTSRWIRAVCGKIIREEAKGLEVDVTQWHAYRLRWSPDRVEFNVDGENVFATTVSPQGPLGLVIWIDNQFMAWKPDGSLRMGTLANPNAKMEIRELKVN
jgi:hypothetical protein